MKRPLKNAMMAAAAVAALAALALGGSALAGAAGSSSGGSTSTNPSTTPPAGSPHGPMFPSGEEPGTAAHEKAEKAVTGADAEKARAAAVASVGGKAGEVTTDFFNHGYEVTVTKSDGSQVTVHLDRSFKVMQPGGPGGPGGPPPGAGYGSNGASGGPPPGAGYGSNSGAPAAGEPAPSV